LIGTGALGAPIAIELARNGVSEQRLLDHDQVEPGNSIRWPLGADAWGKHKVLALKQHIELQYPGCQVVPLVHQLGGPQDVQTDDESLEKMLQGADLVIDASASHGINRLLWDHCQRERLPLVRLGATPNVAGGTVVLHMPDGGCPVCLQWHREEAHPSIPSPPGADSVDLIQPPGCGERTFRGADYDLQELSLQAVRVVVGALSADKGKVESMAYTLALQDSLGSSIPPAWETSALPPHPKCSCSHGRNQHEHANSTDEQEAA
jgi:molybdopterin/thiamine biosynthesis adenylyltransferase